MNEDKLTRAELRLLEVMPEDNNITIGENIELLSKITRLVNNLEFNPTCVHGTDEPDTVNFYQFDQQHQVYKTPLTLVRDENGEVVDLRIGKTVESGAKLTAEKDSNSEPKEA